MGINDLDDLKIDIQKQAAEMEREAERLSATQPEEAENLRRISHRLKVYMSDFLIA